METITLEDARRVIAAAEEKAAEIGCPMDIAVVDAGGHLKSHVRMDGAFIGASISRSTRLTPPSPSRPRPGSSTP
ncbi:MAG TPA: heme-binding protein [Rubrobacter sp.]|nr:heme-binding protein [Rubrobacter sp.]